MPLRISVSVDVVHRFVAVPKKAGKLTRILAAITKLQGQAKDMTEASDRLTREVGETIAGFAAVAERFQSQTTSMQAEIDALKAALANGDTEAANAAADALDALQTEMAATATTPTGNGGGTVEDPGAGEDTNSGGSGDGGTIGE